MQSLQCCRGAEDRYRPVAEIDLTLKSPRALLLSQLVAWLLGPVSKTVVDVSGHRGQRIVVGLLFVNLE